MREQRQGTILFYFFPNYEDELETVQDVKALKDLVKAEVRISFLEEEPDETPGEEEQPPAHMHSYQTEIVKATLNKNGIRVKKCACGSISSQSV